MVSIGFGGGEVIVVGLPLSEVRELLQTALRDRTLLELEDLDGGPVIINPGQVKVLQNSGAPEPFDPAAHQNDVATPGRR